MNFTSQRQAKEVIQKSIDENPRAVYRALLMIHSRQTYSEQTSHQTLEANKMGFSAFDAEILTSFAEQVKERGYLTPKQLELGRKKIRHYWKQLAVMSGGLKVAA